MGNIKGMKTLWVDWREDVKPEIGKVMGEQGGCSHNKAGEHRNVLPERGPHITGAFKAYPF